MSRLDFTNKPTQGAKPYDKERFLALSDKTYAIDFTVEPTLRIQFKRFFKIIPVPIIRKLFTLTNEAFLKTLNFISLGSPVFYISNKRWPDAPQITKTLHIKVKAFDKLKATLRNTGPFWDFLDSNCPLYGLQDPVFIDKNGRILAYVITHEGKVYYLNKDTARHRTFFGVLKNSSLKIPKRNKSRKQIEI